MWRQAQWTGMMDTATASRAHGRVGLRGEELARNDSTNTQKNELKPWLKQCWVIPPQQNAAFVCQMEEVLEVYTRADDPDHPVICFDESNKQLVSERIEPLPMQPDQPQRYDDQDQRHGVCNLFVFFEPLGDWRHIQVTQQPTAVDYAQRMKYLVGVLYPHATRISVVQDQHIGYWVKNLLNFNFWRADRNSLNSSGNSMKV